MHPSRKAAHTGVLSAVMVLAGSLSLIWARQPGNPPTNPGSLAPAFVLADAAGDAFDSTARLAGRVSVLCFTSAQCPASNRYRARILELARQYSDAGVRFVAIHPTDTALTAIQLDEIRIQDRVTGQRFPTLIDTGRQVAASYGVVQTPLFVVLDRDGRIRYRGTFDDNPDADRVSQQFVADAVRALIEPAVSQMAYTQAGGSLLR